MNTDTTPHTCESAKHGVEIQGVYDGVLFWECPICHSRWHRFPEGSELRALAERLWAEWATP